MAKKVIVSEDKVEPTYTNEELHTQSMRDIVEGKEPIIEKEVEEVKEEVAPQPTADEIAEKTAKRLLDEQETRARAQKDQVEADEKAKIEAERTPEDDAREWRDKFEKDHGRTPSWEEAYAQLGKAAVETLEKKQREAAEQAQKEQKTQQELQEKSNKELNEYIDEELDVLTRSKIMNKNNPEERADFFDQWGKINMARRAAGKRDILSASTIAFGTDENGRPYYTKKATQPVGADAPIFGNKGSSQVPSDTQKINYARDIAKKPWSFFRKGR